VSDQTELHGQLALYVNGALTQAELIVFDDHLQRCSDCQSQAPRLFETVAALIPDSAPPRQTWSRIVAAIGRS
jgi:hypothetical protein